MGILLAALAGGADASLKQDQVAEKSRLDTDRELAVGQQNSDLVLQRTQALAVFQENLKNAPINRISQSAQQFSQQDVPVTAPPLQNVSPTSSDASDGPAQPSGFSGNISKIQSDINALPAGPDKDAAMAQLNNQIDQDKQTQQGIIGSQTRKMTGDEALTAALAKAKIDDPVAYAAGKTVAQDKYINIADGATLFDQTTGKAVFSSTGKMDRLQIIQDAKDTRSQADRDSREAIAGARSDDSNSKLDALIKHWADSDAAKAAGASRPEKLTSMINSQNMTLRDLYDNKPGSKSNQQSKDLWQANVDAATNVRNRATAMLNESLNDRGAPDADTPTPAPANALPQPASPASPKALTFDPVSGTFK
jgi:hypothetical protein